MGTTCKIEDNPVEKACKVNYTPLNCGYFFEEQQEKAAGRFK